MPRKRHSKTQEEMIQVWIPKTKIRRPIPLAWGFAACALFGLFAVVTQFQFNRIANEKIYQARIEQFHSDEQAYDAAVNATLECLNTASVRDTYRTIFLGIDELFHSTANLPANLFPDSPEAAEYRDDLGEAVDKRLTQVINGELQHPQAEDCPPMPTQRPKFPEE